MARPSHLRSQPNGESLRNERRVRRSQWFPRWHVYRLSGGCSSRHARTAETWKNLLLHGGTVVDLRDVTGAIPSFLVISGCCSAARQIYHSQQWRNYGVREEPKSRRANTLASWKTCRFTSSYLVAFKDLLMQPNIDGRENREPAQKRVKSNEHL